MAKAVAAAGGGQAARVDGAGLAGRATELLPHLRAAAAEADALRRIPDASIAALVAAGLPRVFQPARFGGPELPMSAVLPLVAGLASACPSTAWVLAVLQIHAWIVGLFPDAAQEEVFGGAPGTLVAGVLQPRGTARPEAGGYLLEAGRWPFASGGDHGEWALVGALVPGNCGPPEAVLLLLRPGEFSLFDDWHVTGLRGTGSKSIATAGGVFVPAHRALAFRAALSGDAGAGRTPLYRAAFVPMLSLNVTGPALGAARQAVEQFTRHLEGRTLPFSAAPQIAAAQTHRQVGEAKLRIGAAELVLERAAAAVATAAERNVPMTLEARARVRAESAWAVRACLEAVEGLYLASGGGVLQEAHPLARLHRDVHGMSLHAALNLDNNVELYGAAVLGQPLATQFV